jgi:O-acetyl-ADP-ribose deacetylase (regulator of RNase III)
VIVLKHSGVTVECLVGDITDQADIDVVVNAANAQLLPGGGVAGAIHRVAGPGLEAETQNLSPIKPGQAVITGAHHLPNRHVIHCLGPVFGVDEPSDGLLAACYRDALRLADEHRLRSIAFPAISTGAFGFPADRAARISIETVGQISPGLEHIKLVRFVLFSGRDLEHYERAIASS